MKVLWVCSTPCSATEKLSSEVYFGSWLRSLELALSETNNIDLHICFYWPQELAPFKYNNSKFYPVLRERKKTSLLRALGRHLGLNQDDKELRGLVAVLKLVAPDVVHIHGTEENFGLLQKYTQVPTVVSLQGIINPYLEKFYAGIPQDIATRSEPLLSKLLGLSTRNHFKRFQKQAIREREIFALTKNFIGRTAWDREQVTLMNPTANYFHAEEMLRPVFYESQWSNERFSETLQIVTTSSDSIYKGYEVIVETCERLKKSGISFVWKVIGLSGDSNLVRTVENWKKTKAEHLNIELLGNCNETKICQVLLQADLYCQVSHIENSPNSLCEAMILGMPVIASDCGGTPSLLKSEEEGILYPTGNSEALFAGIIDLRSNFNTAKKMGEAGRQRALQRHDKKSAVKNYQSIYSDILK